MRLEIFILEQMPSKELNKRYLEQHLVCIYLFFQMQWHSFCICICVGISVGFSIHSYSWLNWLAELFAQQSKTNIKRKQKCILSVCGVVWKWCMHGVCKCHVFECNFLLTECCLLFPEERCARWTFRIVFEQASNDVRFN